MTTTTPVWMWVLRALPDPSRPDLGLHFLVVFNVGVYLARTAPSSAQPTSGRSTCRPAQVPAAHNNSPAFPGQEPPEHEATPASFVPDADEAPRAALNFVQFQNDQEMDSAELNLTQALEEALEEACPPSQNGIWHIP